MTASRTPVRLDKWLWAARFFKTRRLATDAIAGGKVQVNGQRCKPSRSIQLNDTLIIRKGPVRFVVVVLAISSHRGPAPQAETLYRETPASREERESLRAGRGAQPKPPERARGSGRPTKRERRRIERWQQPTNGDASD